MSHETERMPRRWVCGNCRKAHPAGDFAEVGKIIHRYPKTIQSGFAVQATICRSCVELMEWEA